MSDLADVDMCQITSGIMVSVISLLESHPLRAMDAVPSADKARLLAKIRLALEQPDAAQLRPAWATGL